MRRKLIQHGMSSLTIALPKKWLDSNNLKKGDEIIIEPGDRKLVITTEHHEERKKVQLDITGAGPMIRRIIGATFKAGYDEVRIRYSTFEELRIIQDLVREHFTGFEIVSLKKDSILVKNIYPNEFTEFPTVLRRFFLVLNQMAEETHEAAKKNDLEWQRKITLLKRETDKFADYCRRAIMCRADIPYKKLPPLYTIIEQQEKIADRYKDLLNILVENDMRLSTPALALLKDAASFQRSFYELFYIFSQKGIVALGESKLKIQKRLDKAFGDSPRKELIIISLIDRIIETIFNLNGPLMALNI